MFDILDLDYTIHPCLSFPEIPISEELPSDIDQRLTSTLPIGDTYATFPNEVTLYPNALAPGILNVPILPPRNLTPARLYGTPQDDVIQGSMNPESIYGFGGNDALYGNDGNDLIEAGDGNDIVEGGIGDDTLYGNDGNDFISGDDGNDFLGGGNGNDTLYGGAGHDLIESGDGDDFVRGGSGDDGLYGLGGNDYLDGGEGNDQLFGESGNDGLFGGEGEDCLYGGEGDDRLAGALGDDHLHGEAGNDGFHGGEGNDVIFGGAGNDYWISGDEGDDTLYGGIGNDLLLGGVGNDYIQGSEGNSIAEFDTLFGGRHPLEGIGLDGRDTFVLGNTQGSFYYETGIFNDPAILRAFPDGYATIEDFNRAEGDTIQLYDDASLYQIIYGSFSGNSSINDAMIVRLTPIGTSIGVDRIGLVVDAPNLSLNTDVTFV